MKTKIAVAHFKNRLALAKAIGIKHQAVYMWGEIVPYHSALSLVKASDGALELHEQHYDRYGRPKVKATASRSPAA